MASSSTSPPTLNKQGRAKLAKDTINNIVPHILENNKRAQDGVNASELIHYSPDLNPPKRTSAPPAPAPDTTSASTSNPQPPPSKVKVTVLQSDTYDAVHTLLTQNPTLKTAALNMASALHPGGGVLRGALAQEESLCMRSTLYSSLKDPFYRIPTLAGIYSPDILVFRSASLSDLPKAGWYYTDVISVAAIKNPELAVGNHGRRVYDVEEDREDMVRKIRLIFQIAKQKGVRRLVLGALGCGAYRNPPEEVARIFRKVIFGDRKREGVQGIEEVVFAIFDEGENLRTFREVFKEESEE
jgi:uncharacterized protein (TIGR02452 family)